MLKLFGRKNEKKERKRRGRARDGSRERLVARRRGDGPSSEGVSIKVLELYCHLNTLLLTDVEFR